MGGPETGVSRAVIAGGDTSGHGTLAGVDDERRLAFRDGHVAGRVEDDGGDRVDVALLRHDRACGNDAAGEGERQHDRAPADP